MNTDHATLERIAREIAASRGVDFDAPRKHRAHWLALAWTEIARREANIQSVYGGVKDALANIMGGRW